MDADYKYEEPEGSTDGEKTLSWPSQSDEFAALRAKSTIRRNPTRKARASSSIITDSN